MRVRGEKSGVFARDKLSSAWSLCIPGTETTLSPAEFAEVMATFLCLPSPVCKGRVGEQLVGRKKVDAFGDEVVTASLPGGGHKWKHDDMKNKLAQLMRWAKMDVRVEVFGLFARVIPQEGLSRIDRGRMRQGIVPDFMVNENSGIYNATLADLKFINGTAARYPRKFGNMERFEKAVQKRATLVDSEYKRHAIKLDVGLCNITKAARGQLQEEGPVQKKLADFGKVEGWCFGVWGEASDEVHSLLNNIVEARIKVDDQSPGKQGGRMIKDLKSQLVGSVRRQVSLTAVRANARMLISRMESYVGQGASDAAKRRQFIVKAERMMVRERKAQALSASQGRSIVRRGEIRID